MLQRRLRLLQAVSLNMSMMVGVGPFITIPAIIATMGGPQAMLGWILGAVVALADGFVWCELASAFPGSGGTYHFFDAAYGESLLGRSLKFLFVWQFLFSGPLEVATGAIGLAQYVSFFFPQLQQPAWNWGVIIPGLDSPVPWFNVLGVAVMGLVTFLAYRRIEVAGRLLVVLWVGMLFTVGWVIATGLSHFDARLAFSFPEHAWDATSANATGLGMALAIAMYDFLGYYQICYLGDEVEDPSRTIPRAILISVLAIAAIYLTMNVCILGVLPWQDAMRSTHVASDMMERVLGSRAAGFLTVMIIWTALASTFAALLGYSRVPYASAKAGHFPRFFAATHAEGDFPHRSLMLIGGLGMLACLADLGTVIAALLTSRILVQFVGQIATVFWLRRNPEVMARLRFRMPFFPIPAIVALVGWLFVFGTSKWMIIAYGLGSLVLGVVVFMIWDAFRRDDGDHRSRDEPAAARG
ncbi:APC family permease [Paludisphaera mucosa]|uniref:APC family permease n=1 Tax=Paludisphaera mucosa TaxID=3030827 RepID=A0ABT6F7B3_9BACT|nr:APC family permease [Paludisphaera mucosa]MDG3003371.1 APC family permease [Paludisphaera mucosa]